jgi:ectoine hydroxylase-related dioxygenase (phytanoyl-CoA dioxygenase family)
MISQTSEAWLCELRTSGYCIITDAIDLETIGALNADLDSVFEATPFCDGDFYGRRTKRFGSLLKRSSAADRFIRHPLVLEITRQLLLPWCERINLNLTQAIEIHPGAPAQFPHRDQDMWQGAKGEIEYLVNVMWPLFPFTAQNGATIIWPKDREPEDKSIISRDQAIAAEMKPGSALLFLGSTLHCGGGNVSNDIRRGLIVSYCLGWLKPFENQWLVYPPEIAKSFEPELAALVGYSQHRPNLGNVEGQCPSMLLKSDLLEHPAATDALRPDQAEALAGFVAGGSRI